MMDLLGPAACAAEVNYQPRGWQHASAPQLGAKYAVDLFAPAHTTVEDPPFDQVRNIPCGQDTTPSRKPAAHETRIETLAA